MKASCGKSNKNFHLRRHDENEKPHNVKKVKVYQINNDDGSGRVRLTTLRTEITTDTFVILYRPISCRLREGSLSIVNQGVGPRYQRRVSASIRNVINENNTRGKTVHLKFRRMMHTAMMQENFLVD